MLPLNSEYRRWETIERLVYKIANQVYFNRVMAAHLQHRITLEDLVQEGALTWTVCMERYNPEDDKGAKFSTYLAQACWQNLNRAVDRVGNMKSGEQQTFTSLDDFAGPESDTELHELIPGTALDDGEAVVALAERLERARRRLSPMARLVYDWMYDPPEWILEEVEAARQQVALADAKGVGKSKHLPADFTLVARIVKRLWGLSDGRLRKIRTEIGDY